MRFSPLALVVALAMSACLNIAPRDLQQSASSNNGNGNNGNGNTGQGNSTTGNTGNTGTVAACAPLPAPSGSTITVAPSQAASLPSIVASAASGTTILLQDGTYTLTGGVMLGTTNVTLRSESGNRSAVILDGAYAVDELIGIQASNVTVADITIKRAYTHPIHVQPIGGNVIGVLIHNVHVIDPRQQAIKINPNGARTLFVDHGEVRCSHLEMTAAGRPNVDTQSTSCYTGGVDAHGAWGWSIHDNLIEGFYCPGTIAEHGIHMWTGSRDTQIYRNVLKNNSRGIGLGMLENPTSRTYPDDPCGGQTGIGHYGGFVANNLVITTDASVPFDSGIGLEQVCEFHVLHNTVASVVDPFSGIEYRWSKTSGVIANNLTTHDVRARDNATATLVSNLEDAPMTLFAAPGSGDFHLLPTAAAAIDVGSTAYVGLVPSDYDVELRDAMPDIGADEYRQ